MTVEHVLLPENKFERNRMYSERKNMLCGSSGLFHGPWHVTQIFVATEQVAGINEEFVCHIRARCQDARVIRDLRLYYTEVDEDVIKTKTDDNGKLIGDLLLAEYDRVEALGTNHVDPQFHKVLAARWAEGNCLLNNLTVAKPEDQTRA